MKLEELCLIHQEMQTRDDKHSRNIRSRLPALLNYQFHIIVRVDNTTQLSMENLGHIPPLRTLKTRLNWSKNVQEERDSTQKLMLGSMEPIYCVLISLVLWLEFIIESNPVAEHTRIPEGGHSSMRNIEKKTKEIFEAMGFSLVEGPLGTHSVRKFGARL